MIRSKLALLLVLSLVAGLFTLYIYDYDFEYFTGSTLAVQEELEYGIESEVATDDTNTTTTTEDEGDTLESSAAAGAKTATTTTAAKGSEFLRLGKPETAKLKVFGFADAPGDGFCGLLRSMSANQLEANFWGFEVDGKCTAKKRDKSYEFNIRHKKLSQYMGQTKLEVASNPATYLVFIDAFDVLFQADASTLIDIFLKKFGKTGYVIGAEKHCYPVKKSFKACKSLNATQCPSLCAAIQKVNPTTLQSQYDNAYKVHGIESFSPKLASKRVMNQKGEIRFPNSGFQMGTAKGFLKYFEKYFRLEGNHDKYSFFTEQHIHLAMFANETKDLDNDAKMDLNASLVFNVFAAEADLKLRKFESNERPLFQHLVTNTIPPVIHLNGPAKYGGKIEALSEMLWFNTLNLYHIVPDDYKCYAVTDKDKHEHSYWDCCSGFEERWFQRLFGNDTAIVKKSLDKVQQLQRLKSQKKNDNKRYGNMSALLNLKKREWEKKRTMDSPLLLL